MRKRLRIVGELRAPPKPVFSVVTALISAKDFIPQLVHVGLDFGNR
jgi:hypothetical protein